MCYAAFLYLDESRIQSIFEFYIYLPLNELRFATEYVDDTA